LWHPSSKVIATALRGSDSLAGRIHRRAAPDPVGGRKRTFLNRPGVTRACPDPRARVGPHTAW
jgi:hypothetical protein